MTTEQNESNELTIRELETATGGQRVEMRGDVWESNGDGHPKKVETHWAWPLSLVLG